MNVAVLCYTRDGNGYRGGIKLLGRQRRQKTKRSYTESVLDKVWYFASSASFTLFCAFIPQ